VSNQLRTEYGYDLNSNRTTKTENGVTTNSTFDAQDRLTSSGVFQFTYNATGEIFTKTNTLTQDEHSRLLY